MELEIQSTMCRICMRSDPNILYGLFDHTVDARTLAEVVSLVGAVQVFLGDNLPDMCCAQCLVAVEAAYQLRHLCQESDQRLRNMFHPPDIVKKELFGSDLKWLEAGPAWLTEETVSRRQQTSSKEMMDETGQYMCRICMRSDSEALLIGLFEHIVQTQSLAKIVSLVGAVEVQQDDALPKLCCTQCLREVEAAYKLRIQCQESDVKLRSQQPNKTAIVKEEPFNEDGLNSRDLEGLASSDQDLAQDELEKLHPFHVPNKAAVVKKESFSDNELYSQDSEEFASSDEVLVQKEVEKLYSFMHDASKHEYKEITIEETGIVDAGYSESDQSSKNEKNISETVDGHSSNNQVLDADVNKPRRMYFHRLPNVFDVYPAVKFGCCGCESSFDTIEERRAHGREKHCETDSDNFKLMVRQCDICFKLLRNGASYDFHRRNVMFNYRCKICDEILLTMKQACIHRGLKHPKQRIPAADELLICCGCLMQFSSVEELRIHSETIHLPDKLPQDERKLLICNICYRSFTTKRLLDLHKVRYSRKSETKCKECGKSFGSLALLRYHEHSHAFKCLQCPKTYTTSDSLRAHVYCVHQPGEEHHCKECPRSFKSKAALDEHSRIHKEDRPYQCKVCGKSYKTKSAVNQHTQLHETARPFSCPQCPATFKRKSYLITHAPTHDKEKRFPCSQCNRRFSSRSGILCHVRVCHDRLNVKPSNVYVCPVCPTRFNTKFHQIRHIRRQHPEQAPEVPIEAMQRSDP